MLAELRVRDLGVIDDLTFVVGPGMTVLTGETGAGKTLVVSAIALLLGGRADPVLVRPGAGEASVEGRFDRAAANGGDLILSRVVPVAGRARAYIDGHMSSSSQLATAGSSLVDLHGQHAHQSLLSPAVQREVLDALGGVDLMPLAAARRRHLQLTNDLAALGGDARGRARELDLVRFQVDELSAAGLTDGDEEDQLVSEEERLADASGLRQAAAGAHEAIAGDEGALDRLGAALAQVSGRRSLSGLHDRLRALEAELTDAARDARTLAESIEEDPDRLAAIGARRQLLRELRRKYGDSLSEVITYRDDAIRRLADLSSYEERAAALEDARRHAEVGVAAAEAAVAQARCRAAPRLAAAVEARLQNLALARARFRVSVGDKGAGDDVTWLLGANAGESILPLTKVASGGELARTMLAVRLVMTGSAASTVGPRTLVFDEVDAGIGGEAAVAVGRALLDLALTNQVLVVTHLAQVAAFADHHVVVRKQVTRGRTVARLESLDDGSRVIELSRMLSGQPGSVTARRHAEELLTQSRSGSGAES